MFPSGGGFATTDRHQEASRIVISQPGDFLDETQSQALVAWMVETADIFAHVFARYL